MSTVTAKIFLFEGFFFSLGAFCNGTSFPFASSLAHSCSLAWQQYFIAVYCISLDPCFNTAVAITAVGHRRSCCHFVSVYSQSNHCRHSCFIRLTSYSLWRNTYGELYSSILFLSAPLFLSSSISSSTVHTPDMQIVYFCIDARPLQKRLENKK